jgi:hypothetical protein
MTREISNLPEPGALGPVWSEEDLRQEAIARLLRRPKY